MENALPRHYDLLFEPDFKTFKFSGKENVEIDAKTDTLVLNSAELEIKSCNVLFRGKSIPATFKLDEKNEELEIKLKEKISGKVELLIDFAGTLNDKLLGFYRSKYKDEKGKEKFIATTQFEAADARRAFPCWDNPSTKATFDVSLLVDGGFEAISNMPVVSKKKIGKKTLFKFDRTPIMSTYLLYLGVGEFEYIEGKARKTLMRVITTKGKTQQGEAALDFGKKLLGFYEDYFGIPYPLPKLDLIAIPDFASGAMENWGAITFRETVLLYDPKNSSTATKQTVADVISHEIAHQWFGNLVTMEWWNDLWLNESFATFMATKAVNHFYPEWDLWDQFFEISRNEAMSLDALKNSHPIEVEVNRPSEIREIFDDISYDKGGCILNMLEDFIGEDVFRKGLKDYLTDHKYANAVTNDLWDALEKVSNKPVKELMNSWIRQIGYPIVEANVSGSKVILKQKRFLMENSKDVKGKWLIPISIRTPEKFSSKVMSENSADFILENPGSWYKINYGQKGFYRVKYDSQSLENLKEVIESKKIDNVDRYGIQSDLFALCASGDASAKYYMNFVKSFFNDDDYLVSIDIADSLYYLYLISSDESFSKEISEFNKKYFGKIFGRLGWDAKPGEKHTNALLRGFVISALGRFGDEGVLKEAVRRFDDYLRDPESLNPDIRSAVYNLVAWSGDSSTYNALLDLYRKSKTQEERTRFQAALSGFQDEKLLSDSLKFSLSDEVKLQDLYINILKVAGNPFGRKLVWPWIKQNWKEISKRFGGAGNPLMNRIIASLSVIADAKKENEIAEFFKKNPTPGTEMKLAQTLERLRINSRFVQRMREDFGAK